MIKVLDIPIKKDYIITRRQARWAPVASNLNTISPEISVMAKSSIPFQAYQAKQLSPANGGICYE